MKQFRNYPYVVSQEGFVYRLNSKKPLKADKTSQGYLRVTLCVNGKPERFLVHRMVAELYCPNPKGYGLVMHLDDDTSNNFYTNLQWGTQSINMLQCHRTNRCSNILASKVAQTTAINSLRVSLKKDMSNRFLDLVYQNKRLHIKYICAHCNNVYTHRADSPSIKRKGVCRSCFISKDEDIV